MVHKIVGSRIGEARTWLVGVGSEGLLRKLLLLLLLLEEVRLVLRVRLDRCLHGFERG